MNIKQFILIGRLEGISSLLLFFLAMPLKYAMDMPWAVKYTGWAHGILFVLFLGSLVIVGTERKWKISSMALSVFGAIIPAGPLIFENYILKREGEK